MTEGQTIRVLLVEDDEEDVAIFRRNAGRLRGGIVTVVHAADMEAGLAHLVNEQFSLVFADLNLGGRGSGIDLLKRIYADRVDVPVVVVTGSGDELKAVEAMKAGAYDYIVKDNLTADLLERTMRNVLKRHSLERERANMVEKLAQLSVTDELTDLANRRDLTRKLDEEVKRSTRTGRPLALLMMDLDHFKEVNDRHGHQTGDDVLVCCAAVLRLGLRETDFLARYGGEEFCALLPETDLREARIVAERLRRAVEALPESAPTISIGLAHWEPDVSPEEVIGRSDKALYRAKETGRNRIVVYGE